MLRLLQRLTAGFRAGFLSPSGDFEQGPGWTARMAAWLKSHRGEEETQEAPISARQGAMRMIHCVAKNPTYGEFLINGKLWNDPNIEHECISDRLGLRRILWDKKNNVGYTIWDENSANAKHLKNPVNLGDTALKKVDLHKTAIAVAKQKRAEKEAQERKSVPVKPQTKADALLADMRNIAAGKARRPSSDGGIKGADITYIVTQNVNKALISLNGQSVKAGDILQKTTDKQGHGRLALKLENGSICVLVDEASIQNKALLKDKNFFNLGDVTGKRINLDRFGMPEVHEWIKEAPADKASPDERAISKPNPLPETEEQRRRSLHEAPGRSRFQAAQINGFWRKAVNKGMVDNDLWMACGEKLDDQTRLARSVGLKPGEQASETNLVKAAKNTEGVWAFKGRNTETQGIYAQPDDLDEIDFAAPAKLAVSGMA
ncbi:MAG: hypothetical protein KDI46_10000 [Alphaproteobacteria bacterium]|nr:hypothetical protein [Alphaproteobacteria bacterium]